MESRAKLFGHPIHQMLIVFPLGLLAMALIFDIIHFATGVAYWSEIAYWMIAAGVISGLVAAPFGLIDWLGIPAGTRAKRRTNCWRRRGVPASMAPPSCAPAGSLPASITTASQTDIRSICTHSSSPVTVNGLSYNRA